MGEQGRCRSRCKMGDRCSCIALYYYNVQNTIKLFNKAALATCKEPGLRIGASPSSLGKMLPERLLRASETWIIFQDCTDMFMLSSWQRRTHWSRKDNPGAYWMASWCLSSQLRPKNN